MNFVLASLQKDLARWRQDAMSVVIWLAIPFLIGGLITAMVDGGGGGPSGVLLIDDQDDTLISGFVAGAFAQDQLGELLTVQAVTAEEGAALIEAGDASGFLTIPEGFQDAFLSDTPVTLTLKTNPAQTIIPGIIEDVTEILLDAGFYLQAMFGDELATIRDAETTTVPDDVFVAGIAVQVQHKIESLQPGLFPPLIELEIVAPPPSEPKPDLGLLFLPGIIMMTLLFSAQGLSADFWKERDAGTLRRLVSTPGLPDQFVFGKALAAAVVVALLAGVTLFLGFLYHDVPWSKFLPSLSWMVLAGVGFFAWFSALQMVFSNQKAANLISTILLFPLMMIGGSFFPLDALPDWLASIGRRSPNGFVVDRLTTELTSASAWTFDTNAWGLVLLVTFAGLALCGWRLRRGFARQ